MLGYKRRDVVESFWDDYNNTGFDKRYWRETSKSCYRYSRIEQDNGELIVDGLRQSSIVRIPCSVHDVVLYLWTNFDKRYICLMFHEVEDKELYVHRYYVKDYRNE